ncbi:MAG TPA: sigma-70 family RNA polymerase sigma factor [Pseudomonadales bacterium]
MGIPEGELLERIARGDEAALESLYRAWYPRLVRFVLRIVRDPGLVEEVINDVFLVIWRSAAAFRGDSHASTWILGIAYRRALKRAGQRRPATRERAEDPDPEEVPCRRLELEGCLARLNPEQRATVELTYYFGYSYREIAEIMKCPENTVKTRMFHARRALRSLLEA